jgi:HSP20 family protein
MPVVNTTFRFREHKAAITPTAGSGWVPNTDVYLTPEGVVVNVELAGMKREDLQLTVEDSRLRIRGQRPDHCRGGKCRFLIMEINYGPFECTVDLPTGYDPSCAKAVYQNGFLRIDIPAAPTKAKRTSVPVAGE